MRRSHGTEATARRDGRSSPRRAKGRTEQIEMFGPREDKTPMVNFVCSPVVPDRSVLGVDSSCQLEYLDTMVSVSGLVEGEEPHASV